MGGRGALPAGGVCREAACGGGRLGCLDAGCVDFHFNAAGRRSRGRAERPRRLCGNSRPRGRRAATIAAQSLGSSHPLFPKGVSVNKLGGSGCGATAVTMALTVSMLAARPPHGTARRDLWPRCVHPWPGERQRRAIGIRSSGRIRSHVAHPVPVFLSAAVIYFACEYFVNGVEWVGHRFELGATATGTVLAAFGTALPESAVTFMAVVFGDTPSRRTSAWAPRWAIPLVLATLAYAVVGLALWRAHRGRARSGLYQRGPAQAGPRPGLVHGHLRLQGRAGAAGLRLEALAGHPVPGHLRPLCEARAEQ